MRVLLAAATLVLVLTACGTSSSEPSPESAPPDPASEPAEPAPPDTADPADTPDPPDGPGDPPDEPGDPDPAAGLLEPTPRLAEGPYYPSEADRPSDQDSDLLLLTGSPVIASGEPLQIDGRLFDLNGDPVAGATIELWQTDAQGIYMNPDDPRVDARDSYFQSYGQSVSDDDGVWSFRTIVPARYEDRPRHLHVKVRLDGAELLTTQIYFAGDAELSTDSLTAALGDALIAVTVAPEPGMDEVGFPIQTASHTIVVDLSRGR